MQASAAEKLLIVVAMRGGLCTENYVTRMHVAPSLTAATLHPTTALHLHCRPASWPSGLTGYDAFDTLKSLAASQTYKGQQGYLVTITSQDEQNFIR